MSIRYFPSDMVAMTKSTSPLVNVKWFLLNHSLHLLFLYRIGQDLRQLPLLGKLFAFVIEYVIRIIFASDLSCKAKIGPGFCIVHGHDIVIGADVKIGKNCKIFNGVTLGNKNLMVSSDDEQPTLGDDVTICTGAKILGGIQIGDDVTVGANAVVIRSCGSNVTLVGVPARIVAHLKNS